MATLGTNTNKWASEVEFYIMLATLTPFGHYDMHYDINIS